VRSENELPTSLVGKILKMAAKREEQAATAADRFEAEQLSAAAKSYRALADAIAKQPKNILDNVESPPTAM
jgi:hypothetical protein